MAREAVYATMLRLAAIDKALWNTLVLDVRGLTLAETVAALRETPGAPKSVTRAHDYRQRAREAFRNLLMRYRLGQNVAGEDELEEEFEALAPLLAEAMADYADKYEPG